MIGSESQRIIMNELERFLNETTGILQELKSMENGITEADHVAILTRNYLQNIFDYAQHQTARSANLTYFDMKRAAERIVDELKPVAEVRKIKLTLSVGPK